MSVEDMERDFRELAERLLSSDLNLYIEIKKIRQKYPKEIRKEYCKRNPADPPMMGVFAATLAALEASTKSKELRTVVE